MLIELHSLTSGTSQTFDWAALFDTQSYFKLLYCLQIVDSIIFPMQESDDLALRIQWCAEFLNRYRVLI